MNLSLAIFGPQSRLRVGFEGLGRTVSKSDLTTGWMTFQGLKQRRLVKGAEESLEDDLVQAWIINHDGESGL